ncbi:MAG: glycosyltransferase family 2 protein [Dethiobacter sp.]|nr:MAG: glycosyltransferase family 2 protein [Dethiobacter sp.]
MLVILLSKLFFVNMERVSIIIPVHNCISFTLNCLKSLLLYTTVPFQIIIVNNASTDNTAAFLESLKHFGEIVQVITNRKNLGFARACNQGYQFARGKYLVFLNNDTEVTPNWLEPMLNCFSNDSLVGMVTPKLLYPGPERIIQYAGVAFYAQMTPYIISYQLPDNSAVMAEMCREIPAAGGACMMLKREVLEKVGLFDERFINGLEDVDLSLRIRMAGMKNILCPKSTLIHHEAKTSGRFIHSRENREYFLQKWHNKMKITATGEIVFSNNF